MRRRSLITFVVLNVLISLGVAFAVISALGSQNRGGDERIGVTFVRVVVTATIDPNATPRVIIITATPLPGQPLNAQLPTGLFETPDLTSSPFATFDLELLSANTDLQLTATALPAGCILHTVTEGDTPFGIAEQYGADGFALMELNLMDESSAANMQIGDVLIVPLEGCSLTAADLTPADEATATATATATTARQATEEQSEEAAEVRPTATPTVRATMTLPPTATNAQVVIENVLDAGDITAEGVILKNTGNTVNINGWTLADIEGNLYTFEEQLLFSGASITLYSREGESTPVVLYWGQDEAVWQAGDVVTLTDNNGEIQSIFRIPEPINLQ